MKDENRMIFRVEALRRYAEGRERPVLPQFTSPRTMLLLWVLLSLLLLSGLVLMMIRVPVYATGLAVVPARDALDQKKAGAAGGATMVVFVPERNLPDLRIGQKVRWSFDQTSGRVATSILAIEPEVDSPADLQKRFGFSGTAAAYINGPMAVAFAHLEPAPGDRSIDKYAGSVYRVDVEIGRRRVISFLPVLGRLFPE